MRKSLLVFLWIAAAGAVISEGILAHHSSSVYDSTRLVTLKGTVAKFEFINPHTIIRLDVKDAEGNTEQWAAGGGAVLIMRRIGWTPNYFKPGEKLIISGFQMKDGRKVMLHGKLVRVATGEDLPTSQTEKVHVDELLEHHHVKSIEELPAEFHIQLGVFD
jgi:hypothetical protein